VTARNVMAMVRSLTMQEQETMWTRFAQDATVQEPVRPAVAAGNDRKYIIKRKVTNFEVRYLFLCI